MPNKALHLTAIPLRSIAPGELGRYLNTNLEMEDISMSYIIHNP